MVSVVSCAAFAAEIRPLQPTRLRTEQRHDEPCVATTQPRLSWWAEGDGRGRRQTAYRILCASRRELIDQGKADLWDSGKVASGECHLVEYGGKVPAACSEVWWTVQVWDEADRASAFSPARRWFVGPLTQDDWAGAKWIAGDPKAMHGLPKGGNLEQAQPMPIFRKGFTLDKPVRRAVAYVSGLGYYDLSINGQRAADFAFGPAWTDYTKRVSYQAHDVTRLLKAGDNAVGGWLGNGFYNVPGGRYVKRTRSDGFPKFFLMLHIEHADGTTSRIVTDNSWKWTEGPILFTCIYGGEDFDARREPRGWDAPGFDDSSWKPPVVVDAPRGELAPQAVPPVVVTEEFVAKPPDASKPLVLDAVQTTHGRPWIKVRGEAGSRVVITYNERGPGGGSPGTSFTYMLRGQGEETWHPRFSHTSLRGLAIDLLPAKPGASLPELLEAKVQALRLGVPEAGGFASSDETLNKIHRRIDWSIRSNLSYVLTDCPHREILGWLEVLHLMAPSLLYRYDAATFYAKTARDMVDAQRPTGFVPTIAPAYTQFGGAFWDSPEWGGAVVLAPSCSRLFTADAKPVSGHRHAMVKWCDYLTAIAAKNDGAVKYGLSDWGNPSKPAPVPMGLTGTWVLYQCLKTVAAVDRDAGRLDQARALDERAAKVFADFQRLYFKADPGTYGGDDQTSLAIAIAGGFVPAEHQDAVQKRLVELVEKNPRIRTGEIGLPFLLRALTDAGRADLVYAMIRDAYGNQAGGLAQTSLCEFWNGGGTANHCMMGHGMEWLYSSLAGIRPDPAAPGFARCIIAPHIVLGLEWVEAHHDSPRGRISVKWSKQQDKLLLDVRIPPGVTALVKMPTSDPAAVTESGGIIKARDTQPGLAAFEVGSGSYRLAAPLPRNHAGSGQ